jgi:endothelin-converting enzyme
VTNTITIFAGIVSDPFYNPGYSPAALYATLGMIIGHELSHAMDNTGRLFDKDGSLIDWWQDHDVSEFERRSQCIVSEYGPPQGCENAQYGIQTLGEDIADITGITLALNAFKRALGPAGGGAGTQQQQIQTFFTIFAQMWAESFDQSHVCNRVENDEHALAWYRVDKTLRQLTAFQRAFGCTDGDRMVNPNQCIVY